MNLDHVFYERTYNMDSEKYVLNKIIIPGTRVRLKGDNVWFIVQEISPKRQTFTVEYEKSVFFAYDIDTFTNLPHYSL